MNHIIRVVNLLVLPIIFSAAFALHLYYGLYALDRPTDFELTFDGAWRLLLGQLPYVDFFMYHGFTVAAAQAAVFKAMGVSYYSTLVHGAFATGVASILMYGLTRRLGLEKPFAIVYALVTAMVFFVPTGMPMPAHYSSLSVLAIFFIQVTALSGVNRNKVVMLYALAGLIAVIGFLSKPIPLAFFLPASAIMWLMLDRQKLLAAFVAALCGLFAGIALLFAFTGFNFDGLVNAYLVTVRLPLAIGETRIGESGFSSFRYRFGHQWGFATFSLSIMMTLVAAAWCARSWLVRKQDVFLTAAVVIAASALFVYGSTLKMNGDAVWRSIPLIFLPVASLHAAAAGMVRKSKESSSPSPSLMLAVSLCLVGLVLLDAKYFKKKAIVKGGDYGGIRRVAEVPDAAAGIPGYEKIIFYSWRAIECSDTGYCKEEISADDVRADLNARREIINRIAQSKNPVELIGLPTVYFALAGKPPLLPIPSTLVLSANVPPLDRPPFTSFYAKLRTRMLDQLTAQKLSAIIVAKNIIASHSAAFSTLRSEACKVEDRPTYVVLIPCASLSRTAAEADLLLRYLP